MKYRFIIKLVLGLLLIIFLVFTAYKLIDALTGFVIDAVLGDRTLESSYENELVTREPMPTMPDYMNDDSFYDNAGSVDFGDE